MMRISFKMVAVILILTACIAMLACAGAGGGARIHPEKVQGPPICGSCHDEKDRARFDHGIGFLAGHRDVARQSREVCELCHRSSFCADCHGYKEELKPSDKHPERTGLGSPHGGDYLSRHRIDGRLNPAPCFGCHGRKNEWRCRECHRS